jgi:hypothetical protein
MLRRLFTAVSAILALSCGAVACTSWINGRPLTFSSGNALLDPHCIGATFSGRHITMDYETSFHLPLPSRDGWLLDNKTLPLAWFAAHPDWDFHLIPMLAWACLY